MTRSPFARYGIAAALLMALTGGAVAAVNLVVDPLWLGAWNKPARPLYCVRDERQNKFDKIAFGAERYETLLIGSSRGTSFDITGAPYRGFNFSVGGLLPEEYKPFIDFFARHKGAPKTIFLAVDFFGTQVPTPAIVLDLPAEHYTERIADPFYRLRNTLSWSVLGYSLAALHGCETGPGTYAVYSKDAVMHVGPLGSRDELMIRLKANLGIFARDRYGPTYVYNDKVKGYFAALRAAYPETRFVVFTTPESAPMYRQIDEMGRFDDYARWLGELVEVFGEVWDFMGVNSFTDNPDNYYDGHHFYPRLAPVLLGRMAGRPVPGYDDFGIEVTRASLAEHVDAQHRVVRVAQTGEKAW